MLVCGGCLATAAAMLLCVKCFEDGEPAVFTGKVVGLLHVASYARLPCMIRMMVVFVVVDCQLRASEPALSPSDVHTGYCCFVLPL